MSEGNGGVLEGWSVGVVDPPETALPLVAHNPNALPAVDCQQCGLQVEKSRVAVDSGSRLNDATASGNSTYVNRVNKRCWIAERVRV